jgi:outer membrane protein
MKKSFSIILAVMLMSGSAFAQKFGYFNSLEVLSMVPEVKAADSDLEAFTKVLQKQGEGTMNDLRTRAASLEDRNQKGTISPKLYQEEMAVLEGESAKLQQMEQEMSAKVAKKREDLYKPILDKVNEKIKEVAKEGGYQLIFDSSTGILLHADEALDVTKAVKAKMGIM